MNSLRLTRANQDVGSFLSVLGSLRETRLTAVLGFLVARFPEEFGLLLGYRPSSTDEVVVEETDAGDRYDVLVRQSGEALIIEGKIGPTQDVTQLLRYVRRMRTKNGRKPALTVVDDGSEFYQSRRRAFQDLDRHVSRLRFVTWAKVAAVCFQLARKSKNFTNDRVGTVVAHELAVHLKEHNMTSEPQPEIYLRDVSSTDSVQLYFRHHIYKCQPNFYNSARRNLYFAPYFTRQTADALSQDNLVPVAEGISFVSRVKLVQVIATRDVRDFLKLHKHPHAREAAESIRKAHRAPDVLIMLLGEPRLMFVSPITKGKLAKLDLDLRFTKGAMGSRTCTFDDLLAASQR